MSRRLRYLPPGSLVETTCRTIQGRHLLRPGSRLNRIVIGILARASRRYGVRVCEPVFMSNHYHLLLIPSNALQLALFMAYVNSNIAREAGRLHDWKVRFWQTRYSHIPVTDEEASQIERLVYLLAQGCKEGLVSSPREWPGVSGVHARLDGQVLRGIWIDRTAEYRASLSGSDLGPEAFTWEELLELAPLPCWAHLSPVEYRRRYAELVKKVETDARLQAKRSGRSPLGAATVVQHDPHFQPNRVRKAPMPWVHAASKASREAFREAYRLFFVAFRQAAEKLRAGVLTALFPEGSFPPPLRFVGLAHH